MKRLELLTEMCHADAKTIAELQAISDSIVRSLQDRFDSQDCSIIEKVARIEKLKERADDFVAYWFFIVKKYKFIFLINEDEVKTNILVHDLNSLGIKAVDKQSLLKFAIEAECVAYKFFVK